jgi:hypothetical protein
MKPSKLMVFGGAVDAVLFVVRLPMLVMGGTHKNIG